MKFTLEKNPSKIFLFTTRLLLLVIPCRKAINSAGTSARQSASESAQLVDQLYMSPNHLFLKPCMLAVSAVHIYMPAKV